MMPEFQFKTFLILGHLLGMTIGLGGATILDILLVRLVIKGRVVRQSDVDLVRFVSKLVAYALGLLWLTGIGFLLQYWYMSPELLPNPKLYAKIAIVMLLSMNGAALHYYVLPLIYKNIGCPLFDTTPQRARILGCFQSSPERFFMLFFGTVSGISWYVPVFLGIAKEMNFVVPAWWIISSYFGLIVFTVTLVSLIGPPLLRRIHGD